MTFSIVGRTTDPETGDPAWGVAVASKYLAVGAAVPAAVAGVGAVATQSFVNVAYKAEGLALLDDGATAEVAVQRLTEDDDDRDMRQLGIVDVEGNAATYTGSGCFDWAGGVAERDVAIQGNILTGPEVVEAMKRAWDSTAGQPLAHRLLSALKAGDEAGGDSRGRQSAALFTVREGAGELGLDDVEVDLRVDDHPDPVIELARLLEIHELLHAHVPEDERVADTPELLEELSGRSRALGHRDFLHWLGSNNLEGFGGPGWTARRVIEALRAQTPEWTEDA